MNLLLDTHVALWWLNDPSRLVDEARAAIEQTRNRVFLSAVSVWEAELKAAAGRLELPGALLAAAEAAGLEELPIRSSHVERAAALPALHRDPFDRILVAQALEDGLVIATRDPLLQRYAVAAMRA